MKRFLISLMAPYEPMAGSLWRLMVLKPSKLGITKGTFSGLLTFVCKRNPSVMKRWCLVLVKTLENMTILFQAVLFHPCVPKLETQPISRKIQRLDSQEIEDTNQKHRNAAMDEISEIQVNGNDENLMVS